LCFFGLSPDFESNIAQALTINITIKDNHALEGGDNFFGYLSPCLILPYMPFSLHLADNSEYNPSSISSSPLQVCFGTPDPLHCYYLLDIDVYPGEQITMSVYVVGESNGLIAGTIVASSKGDVAVRDHERFQKVGISSEQKITYTFSKNSSSAMNGSLSLEPVELLCPTSNVVTAQVTVNYQDCPFGFNLAAVTNPDGSVRFDCQSNYPSSVITSFSIDDGTITKLRLSWVGMFEMDNQSYLACDNYCPLDYCDTDFQDLDSYPDYLDQDEQCQHNRTGVLCGSCPGEWSLVLGGYECRECSSVWLLLILPFALAGLLLVLVIHFLNLTVTMGTICGLIFYANVMQEYSIRLLSKYHPIPVLTPFLQVFLSWLNLDLGISTCFYDGMEAFGKTIFLFVFPIYIWLISGAIIILSQRSIFFSRLMGRNASKIFSTLILLSYSKMIRVTFGILNFKSITVYISDTRSETMTRWAVDGNIPYLDPQKHLILFLIALLSILLLIPFTLSLLFIKQVYYLSNYGRIFSWVDKLKPFFETYTGPYRADTNFKNDTRFWTGLLLLVRLVLLFVNVLDYKNAVSPLYVHIAACLFLLLILIVMRGVYKQYSLDLLECFFIFNICVVLLINTYDEGSALWISLLSHVLVTSVFLAFLGILAYHSYLKLSQLGFINKCLRIRSRDIETDHEDTSNYEGMRGFEPPEEDAEPKYKLLANKAN
jgi:hypothetical protein